MDFIVGRPLKDYPGGPEELSRALGELAAKLQATPVFPSIGDYPSVIGGMFDEVLASPAFAEALATVKG
jgi:hypothetical protein